jgi:uncharacterized protein (TIRG00374 family)
MRKFLVILLLFALGAWLFVDMILQTGISQIIESLSQVSIWKFLLFLVLSFGNMCVFTWRWQLILKAHGACGGLGFFRLWWHRLAGYAVSYMTPAAATGGEPLRIYFNKKDKMCVEVATSATLIDKVLELTVLFLFILMGIFYALLTGVFPDYALSAIFLIFTAFLALIFWFYYATIKDLGFVSSVLRAMKLTRFKRMQTFEKKVMAIEKKMADFYRSHWKSTALLIFLSVFTMFFMIFEHWLVAGFFGVELTFREAFIIGTIPGISYLIPIPGAVGALEKAHLAVFSLMGISINVFAFVLILRLRDLFFVFLGLCHMSSFGFEMLKEIWREEFYSNKN